MYKKICRRIVLLYIILYYIILYFIYIYICIYICIYFSSPVLPDKFWQIDKNDIQRLEKLTRHGEQRGKHSESGIEMNLFSKTDPESGSEGRFTFLSLDSLTSVYMDSGIGILLVCLFVFNL